MASYQPYIVAFYLDGFGGRELATFPNLRKQDEFIEYMEGNNGFLYGQWHKFQNESDFHGAIIKARELGGIVYDLPVKTGVW